MLEPETLFDQYLKNNGYNGAYKGGFDETESFILETVKATYSTMRIETVNKYPRVYIGVVNEYKFNAIAFKHMDYYFIGLNIGLFRIIKNFYNYLFSRNDVFMEIDPTQELNPEITIDLSTIDNYIDTIGDLFGNYDFDGLAPKSDERKKFSKIYAANAVLYLFLHEYGHIVHGHLDYSIDKNKNFNFSEATSRSTSIGSLIKQTLEMDADSFAAVRSIKINHNPAAWSGAAVVTGFSSIFMYQLLSTKIDTLDQLESYSHPLPVIRQSIFMTMIHTFFNQFDTDKANVITDVILKSVLYEYKNVFVDILKLEKDSLTFLNFTNPKVHKHQLDIMNAWNEVHDDLLKFTYGPISEKKVWEYNYPEYLE